MVGGYLIEQHQAVAPVQMPGAVEAQRGVVRVLASAAVDAPSRGETAALEKTARGTAEALGAVAEYLGCRTFPPVFIVHRRDFGPDEFVSGELKAAQGVLVRANLTAKGFHESALQAWLLRETLLAQSGGLAGRERNAWVLDGFLWWWPRSQGGKVDPLDDAARAAARAAMPADFGAAHLRAWLSLRQKIGEEKARTLAGSGLAVLAQRRGADSQRRFLGAMLAPARPEDFRGWVRDVWRSPAARLRAATGWKEADLLREWRAALAEEPVLTP